MKKNNQLQDRMNSPHYEKEHEVFHNNRKNCAIYKDLEDAQRSNNGSLRRNKRRK